MSAVITGHMQDLDPNKQSSLKGFVAPVFRGRKIMYSSYSGKQGNVCQGNIFVVIHFNMQQFVFNEE